MRWAGYVARTEEMINSCIILVGNPIRKLGNQIKENEMDGTCSMHGKDDKFVHNFGWKSYTGVTPLKTVA
jgi:hypothetical protein